MAISSRGSALQQPTSSLVDLLRLIDNRGDRDFVEFAIHFEEEQAYGQKMLGKVRRRLDPDVIPVHAHEYRCNSFVNARNSFVKFCESDPSLATGSMICALTEQREYFVHYTQFVVAHQIVAAQEAIANARFWVNKDTAKAALDSAEGLLSKTINARVSVDDQLSQPSFGEIPDEVLNVDEYEKLLDTLDAASKQARRAVKVLPNPEQRFNRWTVLASLLITLAGLLLTIFLAQN
ncbi:MAG: hypothetical protein AAFP18_08410 [Bacteroidota bacterium]